MSKPTSCLIEVRTRPGSNPNMSHVRLLSDGVLIDRGVNENCSVLAMSIAGPEEAIRCIHGGCTAVNKDGQTGCKLDLIAAGFAIRNAVWGGDWDCRVIRLKDGPVHMVAWCNAMRVPMQKDKRFAVLYPGNNSAAARDAAIYARLLSHYTTPLIPTGITGQPAEEGEVGRRWQQVVCSHIAENGTWWQPLRLHPGVSQVMELPNHWPGAGILRIEQNDLDALVSRLVKSRVLAIPEARKPIIEEQLAAAAG